MLMYFGDLVCFLGEVCFASHAPHKGLHVDCQWADASGVIGEAWGLPPMNGQEFGELCASKLFWKEVHKLAFCLGWEPSFFPMNYSNGSPWNDDNDDADGGEEGVGCCIVGCKRRVLPSHPEPHPLKWFT